MEKTKKWWVISMTTLHSSRFSQNLHYEFNTTLFEDLFQNCEIPLLLLQKKFHDFYCEKAFYEDNGTEEKCDKKDFFIQRNKNSQISFLHPKNGAEIYITNDNYSTKLNFRCLNDNGTFNLEDERRMTQDIMIDICNLLNINYSY